ncbi:MAG: 3'(2'),5'-bisphosphate nucleotidase CysQ [Deltaproteobacteria bacterium]|nr:3'(2'),5'-bisphosphate nucleotidase CysQ [Deltaproteobacteria bacterium]
MLEKEYAVAIEAAKKAGQVIAGYFGRQYTVTQKGQDQPVTDADREANRVIHETILSEFPDDGWLSEETKDDAIRLKKKRVWIVDPLDGTKEFIAKIQEFAVSIALVIEGAPVVGVLNNPMTGELYTGRRGEGAYLNRRRLRVSSTKELAGAVLLASRSEIGRGEWHKYTGKFMIRVSGGMACKMALVAGGEADGSFSLQPKNEWDFAAGVLLIEEAGGIVTDVAGQPFAFNKQNPRSPNIVHGNPFIHKKLIELLRK